MRKKKTWFKCYCGFIRLFRRRSKFIYLGEEIKNQSLVLSNHVGTYAPFSIEFFQKQTFRFWGVQEMNGSLKDVYKYLSTIYYPRKKHWNKIVAKVFCLLAAPVTYLFYRGLEIIPTYRDFRFKHTIEDSYNEIKEGQSFLIFPENSDNGYFENLTYFNAGFVVLLKYCEKRGIDLPIYTTYFDRKTFIHLIDKPILYSEIKDKFKEKEEMAEYFKARCNELGKMIREGKISEETKMKKKKMNKFLKVMIIIASTIASVFLILFGGLNLLKFAIYSEYYSIKTDVCINPGLNEGFIPQGIALSQTEDLIITCGYMNDKSASRVYLTNTKNESRFVKLQKDGKDFTGHSGGIALSNDTCYLANGGYIYTFPLQEAKDNDVVNLDKKYKVNGEKGSASFAYADENYLYVGEFHDGGKYITYNEIETAKDGKYYAIVSCFSLDDLTTPLKVFSVRNKVQGFCYTPEGKIVLSTSYGLASSEYYVYESDKIVDSGKTYLSAPLYILDEYSRMVKGPAMSEDLAYKDGKVYTLTESACDKYIFGKFFFADKIVALEF